MCYRLTKYKQSTDDFFEAMVYDKPCLLFLDIKFFDNGANLVK